MGRCAVQVISLEFSSSANFETEVTNGRTDGRTDGRGLHIRLALFVTNA